jgi:hypothetical protein
MRKLNHEERWKRKFHIKRPKKKKEREREEDKCG